MDSVRTRSQRFSGGAGLVWLAVAALCSILPAAVVANNFVPSCPPWNHTITIINNCNESVTIQDVPGCYAVALPFPPFNRTAGGKCFPPQLPGGEATVAKGASLAVNVMSCYSGNWKPKCNTCTSPVATLAEFTFDGGLSATGDKLPGLSDTYDISMVDGFSAPLRFSPNPNVTKSPGAVCRPTGCASLPTCPPKLVDGDACMSPCQYETRGGSLNNTDAMKRHCCSCNMVTPTTCAPPGVPQGCLHEYGCSPFSPPGMSNLSSTCCPWYNETGATCSATSQARAWDPWAVAYVTAVQESCPSSYSWQFDDSSSTFTCQGDNVAMDYIMELCPTKKTSATTTTPPQTTAPALVRSSSPVLRIGDFAKALVLAASVVFGVTMGM